MRMLEGKRETSKHSRACSKVGRPRAFIPIDRGRACIPDKSAMSSAKSAKCEEGGPWLGTPSRGKRAPARAVS
eukprot:1446308-Rhodomonas_salina.1